MVLALDTTTTDPYVIIANYGLLGAITLAFFTGRVVSAKQYNEMKEDRDKARGELAALRQKLDEQTLPALVRTTDLLAKLAEKR